MKKPLSLILAALLLSPVLIACAEQKNDPTETDVQVTTAAATEEETKRLYADLPEISFEGADAPIYMAYNVEAGNTFTGISKNEFGVEDIDGEVINDARITRNTRIEEKYQVKIVNYDYNTEQRVDVAHVSVGKHIDTLIAAGDNNYIFMLLPGYSVCSMAQNGVLLDLNEMPNLDLEKPWWDQKANADLTVLDRLYFTTGDISTADNDATCTVLFNKVLAENYNLPDLYEMVRNDSWTTEQFYSLCADVSLDVNSDNRYTQDDQYGALVWDDITMAVVNGAGIKCAQTNEDGLVELTLNSEKTVDVLDKFVEFGRDKTKCFQYQRAAGSSDTVAVEMFTNNQALFFMQLMQIVPKLRNMEANFGIIPFPKYDEAQEEYYNTVGSWHSVFFCMPMGSADTEMSTVLAEALACESKYTVTEAFYEKTLKSKDVRDEQSGEMMDIIFETRVYDLGWYYQFGSFNEEVMNLFRSNYQAKPFASMYKTREKLANRNIEKLNDAFLGM